MFHFILYSTILTFKFPYKFWCCWIYDSFFTLQFGSSTLPSLFDSRCQPEQEMKVLTSIDFANPVSRLSSIIYCNHLKKKTILMSQNYLNLVIIVKAMMWNIYNVKWQSKSILWLLYLCLAKKLKIIPANPNHTWTNVWKYWLISGLINQNHQTLKSTLFETIKCSVDWSQHFLRHIKNI